MHGSNVIAYPIRFLEKDSHFWTLPRYIARISSTSGLVIDLMPRLHATFPLAVTRAINEGQRGTNGRTRFSSLASERNDRTAHESLKSWPHLERTPRAPAPRGLPRAISFNPYYVGGVGGRDFSSTRLELAPGTISCS